MTRLLAPLMLGRIPAQVVAVVLLASVLVHVALAVRSGLVDEEPVEGHRGMVHVGTLVRLVAASAPGAERGAAVEAVKRAFPDLAFSLSREPPSDLAEDRRADLPSTRFFGDLGPDARVFMAGTDGFWQQEPQPDGGEDGARRFAVAFPGGDWLHLADPPHPFAWRPLGSTEICIAFMAVSAVLLGFWGVRCLVRPLRELTAAAHDFDIGREAAPLPKHGPQEIRAVTSAFEGLRSRIRSLVEDRTRLLAAMGHDLRTPLTRLRLRSEFVADEGLKTEIQRDLASMTKMIDGALAYLAQGRDCEKPALIDLSAMLQTIADGWNDLGRKVSFEGSCHLVKWVRPAAFERTVNNLVDNALRHGTRCCLRAWATADGGLAIEVEDDGPGIAEHEREGMLQPFVRGDAARNMDGHHGLGLGLAIVSSVVVAHNGTLLFDEADPHGLRVRILLPGGVPPWS